MILVFTTNEPFNLEYAKSLLEDKGIPVLVKNSDFRGAAAGEVPPWLARAEIWVHEKNALAAEQALREVRTELKLVKKPWQCRCGESLEGEFDVCWSCGTARDEIPN